MNNTPTTAEDPSLADRLYASGAIGDRAIARSLDLEAFVKVLLKRSGSGLAVIGDDELDEMDDVELVDEPTEIDGQPGVKIQIKGRMEAKGA